MQERRFSRQREQIYQTVCATAEHPTAEMVYEHLKPQMPRLSLGTVYRNLRQMAQEGRIMELPGPVARFDAVTQPHTHFRCVRCGAVSDLPIAYDASLDALTSGDGRVVEYHSLCFFGLCPACAAEQGST